MNFNCLRLQSKSYSTTTSSKNLLQDIQFIHNILSLIELPPHEIILMPALSPTMTSGNIGTFHKKVGDSLQSGDLLCDIETDKAQMDLEVQEEGFLAKILLAEGTKEVEVGKPLAIVVSKREDVAAFADYTGEGKEADKDKALIKEASTITGGAVTEGAGTSESSTASTTPSATLSSSAAPQTPIANDTRVKASPLAKKLATEQGINLSGLKGSGPNGRIIKSDLPANLSAAPPPPKQQAAAAAYVDLPLSNTRKVIASRLTQSKQEIPHYYLSVDIQMDRILELRSKFNSTALLQETFGSFKLSVNDFIVKAAALALKKVPECNSAWYGDFIRQYETVDICVAVSTPAGLITPIIPAADTKGLVAISGKVKELAGRAKINKLKPEEYQGGTFTISNLGMYGVDSFTAIINPPQSCILAVGATKPVFVADGTGTAQKMTVTLSCDHRVVDGATGARWLAQFKKYLEEPEQMIL